MKETPPQREKLIRDLVAERIQSEGEGHLLRRAHPAEISELLVQKLCEEAEEFIEAFRSKNPSRVLLEGADLYQVLTSMLLMHGQDTVQLNKETRMRSRSLGTFEGRYVLILPVVVEEEYDGSE